MYRVIETPQYYGGTYNAPQEGYITVSNVNVEDNNYYNIPYEWDTEEEAQAWIDEQQKGTYYLSHGEHSCPLYRVESDNDTLADCIDADCDSDYRDCERVDKADIPNNILKKLEHANVEYASSGDSFDIYDAFVDGYFIVFCPTTLALQLNNDDLGGLVWNKETYYKETKELY